MRFFNLDRLRRVSDDVEGGWPGYLFGGRVRTSTVVLILAFAASWWVYDDHREATRSTPNQVPSTQVVPPGFVPDPNYTWVPRTQVQQPPAYTPTPTPTPTTTTPPPPPPVTTTTPPPFVLPTLPCIPPFCTPSSTPTPSPQPGPGPVPTPVPPAS